MWCRARVVQLRPDFGGAPNKWSHHIALVADWLDNGKGTRQAFRQALVDLYAVLMKDGKWQPDSVIVLNAELAVLDGNHRCWAVVKSGVPIQVQVIGPVGNCRVDFYALLEETQDPPEETKTEDQKTKNSHRSFEKLVDQFAYLPGQFSVFTFKGDALDQLLGAVQSILPCPGADVSTAVVTRRILLFRRQFRLAVSNCGVLSSVSTRVKLAVQASGFDSFITCPTLGHL